MISSTKLQTTAIEAALVGDFKTLEEIVKAVRAEENQGNFTTFQHHEFVPLPPAFLELHEGLKAKVNRPELGCRGCAENYVERCGQILAPHLCKGDIVKMVQHFTHPRVIPAAWIEEHVSKGINRRLGNRHA